MKICKICLTPKPLSDYHFANKKKTTKSAYCKRCHAKKVAIYRINNPNDSIYQNCNRANASVRWFYEQLEKQKGLCAICGKPEMHPTKRGDKPRALAIDHDHKTGRLRGLLCHLCNFSIAQLDRLGPEWAASAIEYLVHAKAAPAPSFQYQRNGPKKAARRERDGNAQANLVDLAGLTD